MPYDSFAVQAYQLLHMAFAVWILFFAWPPFVFAAAGEDRMERALNRLVKACFFYIAIGYILVLSHLYEVIAIFFIVLLIIVFPYLRSGKGDVRAYAFNTLRYRFYDLLETGLLLRQRFDRLRRKNSAWVKQFRESLAAAAEEETRLPRWRRAIGFVLDRAPLFLFLIVLAGAVYVRFYDTVTSAVPQMSDSYVHLAIMKFTEKRILFYYGFYPAGFHIILANLHKFAAIDQVFIIKDIGPLMTTFTMMMLYFAIARLTGSRYGGIAAALVYGWFGFWYLHDNWMSRQASANSQEFALAFVIPAFYFTAAYLKNGRKDLLTAVLACCSIAGLVHTFAYAFLDLGVACAAIAACLVNFRMYFLRSVWLAAAGGLSAAVSASQLLIERILHPPDNKIVDFLVSTTTVSIVKTTFQIPDIAALVAMGIAVLSLLIVRHSAAEKMIVMSVVLFSGSTFLIYTYGGWLTQSVLIHARAGDLWGIAAPLAIGMGTAALFRLLSRIPASRVWKPAVCLAVMITFVYHFPLQPVYGYKLQTEGEVRGYLKLSSEYRPTTWTIFTSQVEGFDLALLNGFHSYLSEFVKWYDPRSKNTFPTRYGSKKQDIDIAPDVFVFYEKHIQLEKDNLRSISTLAARLPISIKAKKDFESWLAIYKQTHGFLPKVFYEDNDVIVYEFHLKDDPLNNPDAVWNGPAQLNRPQS